MTLISVRSLSVAGAAAIAVMAAPVAAQAVTTYTVAVGNGACGGTDTACESLVAAAGAVDAGDTVTVAPGTYAESPAFTAGNVTITGSTAAPGVLVTGAMTFSGSGAKPSVLEKVVVAPSTASSSAVGVTGTAGVAVRDSLLVSTGGTGMTIANGAGNSLTRSTIVSGAADGAAVLVQPGAAATSLTLDSSILSGGPSGSGLTVRTGVGQLAGTAGAATVTARHITAAGSANGIVVDSSAAAGVLTAVGNIAATVSDSIVLGASSKKANAGLLLVPPNSATLDFTRTDQATAAAVLFADAGKRNFHLRADAPAIGKAQTTTGDSPTDIDGQPRTNGAASDQGADEFVNSAPKAALAVKTPAPRSGAPVLFDASGSTDREAGIGGEIVKYRWSFGDGQTAETTTAQTNHTYSGEGSIVVTLSVVDKQGAASDPVAAPLRIVDGTPPAVAITKPANKVRIKRSRTTTRTVAKKGTKTKAKVKTTELTPITIAGTAADKSGVKAIVITVQKLRSAGQGSSSKGQCTWLDPSRGLVKRACVKPVLIRPRLIQGLWSYKPLRKLKQGLSAGTYRVSAFGTDNAGAFGNSAARNKVIRFTLTKT